MSSHHPYEMGAPLYRSAGWRGVLPLPVGAKTPPPSGYTGSTGRWPTDDELDAWHHRNGAGNVALRLPEYVVGIDVDDYTKGDVIKHGAAELAWLESVHGPLPRTWVSTARPAPSGIRLYRLPAGADLERVVGNLTPSIEVIWHGYRYCVVWPSWNPEAGAQYRWVTPDGVVADEPPHHAELAELPAAWVDVLADEPLAPPRPATAPARVPEAGVEESRAVRRVLDEPRVWTPQAAHPNGRGRHDLAKWYATRLARLVDRGHPGAERGLEVIRSEFLAATPDRDAQAEWEAIVAWAKGAVATTAPTTPTWADARREWFEAKRAERTKGIERWLEQVRGGGRRV